MGNVAFILVVKVPADKYSAYWKGKWEANIHKELSIFCHSDDDILLFLNTWTKLITSGKSVYIFSQKVSKLSVWSISSIKTPENIRLYWECQELLNIKAAVNLLRVLGSIWTMKGNKTCWFDTLVLFFPLRSSLCMAGTDMGKFHCKCEYYIGNGIANKSNKSKRNHTK